MKPQAMNICFYRTSKAFINDFLFFNLSMELHISNFPNLGNMADVIYSSQWLANPWGLFFVCCSSGGHNGNRIHTQPLSQSA